MAELSLCQNLRLQFCDANNGKLTVRSCCAPIMRNSMISLRSLLTAPRLIHISDLHFFNPGSSYTITLDGTRDNDSLVRSSTLTKFLTVNSGSLTRPGQSPVLIITGDLTDSGDIEDYEFAKQFVTNLMNFGFEVYVTPGNHDYCKYGILGTPGCDPPERRWDLFITEIEVVESCTQTADGIAPHKYPKYADFENGRVILLDSMQDELDEGDASRDSLGQGRLGSLQLSALKRLIDGYQPERALGKKLAVCLHHAPLQSYNNDPSWSGFLKDHGQLMSCLAGDGESVIDCLLFGHTGLCNCGYPNDESTLLIPLINSENLEDVGDNSGPEDYPVTVLDLGTYRRLVFSTSSPVAPSSGSWGGLLP